MGKLSIGVGNRGSVLMQLPAFIDERIAYEPNTGCWIWIGARKGKYGSIRHRGRPMVAHRVVYGILRAPVEGHLECHHTCETKLCVNPDHIQPITCSEHMRLHKWNDKHCKHGHEITPENLYIEKNGYRRCRLCKNATCLRAYYKRKAAYHD